MLTEQLKDEINTEDEVKNGENELEIIDNILTEGNLSDEEINNLLDRRNDLKD
jgi:hypothetical protein